MEKWDRPGFPIPIYVHIFGLREQVEEPAENLHRHMKVGTGRKEGWSKSKGGGCVVKEDMKSGSVSEKQPK